MTRADVFYIFAQNIHTLTLNRLQSPVVGRKIFVISSQISLEIDELTSGDIEEPVVLAKDYRDRNNDDVIEIFYVPKMSDKNVERNDDDDF